MAHCLEGRDSRIEYGLLVLSRMAGWLDSFLMNWTA